jgi:hypothetical protein
VRFNPGNISSNFAQATSAAAPAVRRPPARSQTAALPSSNAHEHAEHPFTHAMT